MGALPPEFRKAVDVPAYQAAQVQYGAIDPETESIRHLERQKVHEEKVENYNISTMDTAEAASTGKVATNVGASALAKEEAKRTEKRARDNMDLQAQLAAMRAAEAIRDEARAKAEGLEREFEEEFGADWRQDIALRVFGPDEFPERQDGESIEDYQDRLVDELIDKMIDPETGEIRPEYEDDPEMLRYAEWAKARHQEREAQAYIDAKKTPEVERSAEQQARIDNMESDPGFDQAIQAQQEASKMSEPVPEISQQVDNIRDDIGVSAAPSAGGSAFA